MDSFLHEVAQRLYAEHPTGMERVTVVFNNRRAGLFLRRELQQLGSRPFFLPRIIGIDELVEELGGLHTVPNEFLLFELFHIHRTMEGVERRYETFEEFMALGEMMVRDFAEIDLYMVDAQRLFENLKELKELFEWDAEGKPPTEFQERYLNFYRSMYRYYVALREGLLREQKAYGGMAYRNVAEHITELGNKMDCERLYFVGFNALSTSERTIVDYYLREGKGRLICDGDAYYVEDTMQEAGHFLRRNAYYSRRKGLPEVGPFENHFAQKPKVLHLIDCPETLLQAKAAGQVVEGLLQEEEAQQCAVVLGDEKLLLPMLNSLPATVQSANVTMGFPYTLTGIHALAAALLQLYCRRSDKGYYHVDLEALLAQPTIGKLTGSDEVRTLVMKHLREQKSIYVAPDDLREMLAGVPHAGRLLSLLEGATETADDLLEGLRRLTALIAENNLLEENAKEREALASLVEMLDYFDQLQEQHHFLERKETLQRIYQRLAQRRSVAFYGEPLSGLQLLGMLETRSLDFSRVVLLSANEGIMPAGRSESSLIPYNLKRAYELPTYEEKDAVYAYNFYRLLQRCDEAWLLYSTDAEGMGKGEPSRFVLQLRDELARRCPNVTVEEVVVKADNGAADLPTAPRMEKEAPVMRRLERLTAKEKGLSPTALNRYRGCPLQFYYSDVLGIWEQEEVNEELEANELGTFIHEILCDIYNRDSDKHIRIATLQQALEETDRLVEEKYRTEVLKGRNPEGKNHLLREVAKMQIKAFLGHEIEQLKAGHSLRIVLTEEKMQQPLPLEVEGKEWQVYLSGTADRIDYWDEGLRVMDYKSGSVKESDLNVKEATPDPHEVPDKWFQVMTYAWLYCRKHGYEGALQSGIVPLRTLGGDFMATQWGSGTPPLTKEHIERFETQLLRPLIEELLRSDLPFEATPDKQRCTYCPMRRTCAASLS